VLEVAENFRMSLSTPYHTCNTTKVARAGMAQWMRAELTQINVKLERSLYTHRSNS
jgi:hypothetical protein